MEYLLSQNSWNGEAPVNIRIPDDWKTEYLDSPVNALPVLSKMQLRGKFDRCFGSKPLSELARGKKSVTILIDDLTRATPVRPVAEIVLDILAEAGVAKSSIQFISALGAHSAMSQSDFVHKLGPDIVREYPAFNHNCYENCTQIGTTSTGVPVELNNAFLSSDLRIGIGSIVPHPMNGFGGGGKIIAPGICSMKTIAGTHIKANEKVFSEGVNPLLGTGTLETAAYRSEVEEIVRMCGFEFKIDIVMNTAKGIVDLFMGDPIDEYYAAADVAKDLYWVEPTQKYDVVIANANAKASEAGIAYNMALMTMDPDGAGDLVLVDHVPDGQCVHYLCNSFGRGVGGPMWHPGKISPTVKRFIFYTPYPHYYSAMQFCDPPADRIIWAATWEEVESLLRDRRAGTRCGIFADATLQHIRRTG